MTDAARAAIKEIREAKVISCGMADRLADQCELLILERDSLARELDRLRHGNTIEGDFVCPNEVALVEARRVADDCAVRLGTATAERDALRADLEEACEIAEKMANIDDTLDSGRILGMHLGQQLAALRTRSTKP